MRRKGREKGEDRKDGGKRVREKGRRGQGGKHLHCAFIGGGCQHGAHAAAFGGNGQITYAILVAEALMKQPPRLPVVHQELLALRILQIPRTPAVSGNQGLRGHRHCKPRPSSRGARRSVASADSLRSAVHHRNHSALRSPPHHCRIRHPRCRRCPMGRHQAALSSAQEASRGPKSEEAPWKSRPSRRHRPSASPPPSGAMHVSILGTPGACASSMHPCSSHPSSVRAYSFQGC